MKAKSTRARKKAPAKRKPETRVTVEPSEAGARVSSTSSLKITRQFAGDYVGVETSVSFSEDVSPEAVEDAQKRLAIKSRRALFRDFETMTNEVIKRYYPDEVEDEEDDEYED